MTKELKNITKKNEKLFSSDHILEAFPNYAFWKDKNLVYLGCNRNAAQLLGFKTPSEIVGKTDNELPWDTKFIEQMNIYDQEVINTQSEKTDIGEVLVLSNGKVVDVVTDRKIFYDEQGEVAGILFIAIESKKRNLSDQDFFEHILKSLPYYIFWKNRDSIYLGCNANFSKLVGYSSKKIVGLTDFDLGWGKGEAEFYRQADQEVMQNKVQVNIEETLKRADGSEIIMLVSKVPVRNKVGDIIGMLGISVDITSIKQAERESKIAKEKAEFANQAKSDFIASMSHDLRTPLNAILGIADILRMKQHYSEQLPLIESINNAGNNLLRLIEDILNFSKLEAGKQELYAECFDLRQLIEDVINMISHKANSKKLKLITLYAENIPRHVISDPNATRRILINLLSNAIKFTEEGHVILSVEVLKIARSEVTLQITVEDTGIGIAAKNIDSIFDRFSRVELSYESKFEGVGLGLTIAKQLANNLGGEISVISKPEQGSTFYCTLPFKLQKSTHSRGKIKSPLSDLNILIVDDYQSRAKIRSKQLGVNCQVIKSDQVMHELRKAHKNNSPFHIALIDDEITECPYALTQSIKEHGEFSNLMLVLCTRPVSLAQSEKALTTGFSKLLVKPIQSTEINELVDAWNSWKKYQQRELLKFKGIRVLLVEDDPLSRLVCKTFLEELGCTVDFADCGEEALQLLKQEPKIIFMDIGLQGMSGIAVTQKIRKLEKGKTRTPIVALTAHTSEQDERQCLESGMDVFITKPISYSKIEELLEKFLNPQASS